MKNKEVKNIVASYTSAKKKLKKLAPNFNWGNLLGDYGEYLSIEHYELVQAPTGNKGYDATNKQNKTIQIKTVSEGTKSIKFSKGADYLLVIKVDENADWEEVYYGNFDKIRKASTLTKNGEYTIGKTKLKKIANNTYRPREEISLTLETGTRITALTREELRQKLIRKGYSPPAIGTINRRINDFEWELERAFGIKVPPNYSEVEHYIDKEGYKWFPKKPTVDKSRTPLVSDFEERVYIAQKYFCEDKGIPDWYVSEKLKKGWDSSRIIMSYKEIKRE